MKVNREKKIGIAATFLQWNFRRTLMKFARDFFNPVKQKFFQFFIHVLAGLLSKYWFQCARARFMVSQSSR